MAMKALDRLHSIQFKLTFTFLLILLPLVSVSVFANYYSQTIMNEQIGDRTKGALLTTLEYVNQLTQNMDQQTLLIGSNPNIVELWNNVDNPLNPDHLYELHTVQQQLSALTNVNGAVKEAFIIHGDSENGVSTLNGGVKWPGVKNELWFKRTLDASGGLVVHVPTSANAGESAYLNKDTIYYARLLDVFGNNKEPNVLVLTVDKTALGKIIQHLQTSKNMNISLYYNDDFVLETNRQGAKTDEGAELFSIETESGFWSIRQQQPQSELFQLSHKLQQFTYLIIVISVLLAVWIAWLVYSGISKPLHQLSAAFKQFSSGNLKARVSHRRRDEFGYVMNGFNRMSEAQRQMIEDDYEKELRLAKSEFSLLQSQINPHFLYNTLDSIYSVALKNQIHEISEMVINLARFFRVSLGKGKDSFTLEETIQHLMYYIRVQQFRSDHFNVEIDVKEETKPIPLLKLILQPIVENAIVHGLEKSMQGGELRIRTSVDSHYLRIDVEDTGTGIPPDKLTDIQHQLGRITSKSYRSPQRDASTAYYGLKNVKSRLKMYYGEEAELTVTSVEGEGTQVTLHIPLREEEAS
ncbi:sensor histidine kinase [Paenibacillus sp. HJGM_3]|uniref:sensor histidine kinase n=1 Tax=Paenibacillus sp. HJGM_3 TaxID=3379816 RepID=UPI00385E1700